jgi:hypothetical protein
MASKYYCEVWAGGNEVVKFGAGNLSMDAAKTNVAKMLPGLVKSKGFDIKKVTAILISGNDVTAQILDMIQEGQETS